MKRSKPSATPKSLKKPGGSTTSWTIPQPTDVISYVFLWSHEAAAGRDEGSKERPVVVVLATRRQAHRTEILVAPVTTKPPRQGTAAVEMPERVRRHLGLGDERCWIVADEVNRFTWPGPDIRPIRAASDTSPFYGKIPGKLFEQVRANLAETAGRLKVITRTE
jgi:mRNA-degrading endonuclease toxin of MazEF toxin-antitoxin module